MSAVLQHMLCMVIACLPLEVSQRANAQPIGDDSNAATSYLRAVEKYRALPASFRDEISYTLPELEIDAGPGPSHEVRQALSRLRPMITLTVNGARRTTCRFVVDRSDLAARGNFVGDLRLLMRLLWYDYCARIDDQDVRGAMEHIITMYRISAHGAQEDALYGALAANAALHRAEWMIDRAIDHAMIGPAEAANLLREIDRFERANVVDFAKAMAAEQRVLSETIATRYEGEEGLEAFRAAVRALGVSDAAVLGALDDLTPERAAAMFRHFSNVAGGLAEALANPDPTLREGAFVSIQQRMDASEFAALNVLFVASNVKIIAANDASARSMLKARRDLLTNIASGAIDPLSLANAAIWYARAAKQAKLIDPDKRRVIDSYFAKHDEAANHEVATILNRHDVQTLMRTLTDAASIDRCEWKSANAQWPYVHAWLHADILWCGRLLTADAARMFHAQRYDDAAQRMATAYAMAADIAAGGTIGSSLAAHRIFNDIDALAAAAIGSGMLNEAQTNMIARGVNNLARGDPFHYQPAIARLRQHVSSELMWLSAGMSMASRGYTKEEYEAADELVKGLSASRLLSIVVVAIHWQRAQFPLPRRPEPSVHAAGLESIFDVQAIREAADHAGFLVEWSKTHQVSRVREHGFPVIADVDERAKQSLSDYRACVLRMDRATRPER